jgi:general secretion pathway protein K
MHAILIAFRHRTNTLSYVNRKQQQRGVAVVTALLLTTLAVTIVASVFWQQQVQMRAVENQRSQSQTQWVMRAALDWTRIILREDARTTAVDQLGESWAIPLPETPLDDYLEDSGNHAQEVGGTLSGYVIDAQSRYNLTNLAEGGVVNPQELAVFRHLLGFLGINPNLAEATASAISATQLPAGASPPSPEADSSHNQPASFIHNEDLITIPGYTAEIIEKLKNYVVILPAPTAVNVNTANREVLAAKANLPLDKAGSLIASRAHAYFVDTKDFQNRAQADVPLGDNDLSVNTHYFLVFDKVKWDRANLNMQALIYRKDTGNTTVKWLRQ